MIRAIQATEGNSGSRSSGSVHYELRKLRRYPGRIESLSLPYASWLAGRPKRSVENVETVEKRGICAADASVKRVLAFATAPQAHCPGAPQIIVRDYGAHLSA